MKQRDPYVQSVVYTKERLTEPMIRKPPSTSGGIPCGLGCSSPSGCTSHISHENACLGHFSLQWPQCASVAAEVNRHIAEMWGMLPARAAFGTSFCWMCAVGGTQESAEQVLKRKAISLATEVARVTRNAPSASGFGCSSEVFFATPVKAAVTRVSSHLYLLVLSFKYRRLSLGGYSYGLYQRDDNFGGVVTSGFGSCRFKRRHVNLGQHLRRV